MKLNHINLAVTDVEATAAFFEKHFGFTTRKLLGNVIAIQDGSDGFVLVLSNLPKSEKMDYPPDFHIGFYRDTKEQVIEILDKLKTDGYAQEQEAKQIRDRFGFYFYAPGNILTEVTSAAE